MDVRYTKAKEIRVRAPIFVPYAIATLYRTIYSKKAQEFSRAFYYILT